jgi:hypothetical protein
MDKTCDSPEAAVADVHGGATVMIGASATPACRRR